MNHETQITCNNLLAAMNAPSQPWSESVAALYVLTFEGWDDELALETVKHAAMTCKFRPAPCELREIAISLSAPLPSLSELVEQARSIIRRHATEEERKAAAGQPGIHPLVNLCIDHLGGWMNAGMIYETMFPEALARALPGAAQEWQEMAVFQKLPSSLSLPVAKGFEVAPSVGKFIASKWRELDGDDFDED